MGDNPVSTSSARHRKLPIPSADAHANANLKRILTKPKRKLPALPENTKLRKNAHEIDPENNADDKSKLKRIIQESAAENTADDSNIKITQPQFNHLQVEKTKRDTSTKCLVPKIQIDMDRLKNLFQLQGSSVSKTQIQKIETLDNKQKNLNANDIDTNESNGCVKDERDVTTHSSLTGENKAVIHSLDLNRLSKVKEWCSTSDRNKETAKMSSDYITDKSVKRGTRSPSSKCSTTWDRSSSGYSSDEKADPRSPPTTYSASTSICSKTETDVINDDISESEEIVANEDANAREMCQNFETKTEFTNEEVAREIYDAACNRFIDMKCDYCDVSKLASNNVICSDKFDTVTFNVIFDNAVNQKTSVRRPTLLAHSTASGKSRIQYRKSVSEPVISLRQPLRQCMIDLNLDELEVCGKSLQQTTNSHTFYVKSESRDNINYEMGIRSETSTPSSAFSAYVKQTVYTDTVSEIHKNEPSGQDIMVHLSRHQCLAVKNPRSFKPLNVKLQDDRDIRKSLHELNLLRRLSPDKKSVPIRARHTLLKVSGNTNQATSAIETINNQVANSPNSQRTATSDSGKFREKHFIKQMWRAPPGQPENAQVRPFSPFGGTLPPAMINERKIKKTESCSV